MRLENLVKARITLQNIHSVNKFYADFSNTLVSYLSKDHDILRKDLNRFKPFSHQKSTHYIIKAILLNTSLKF
jgi:hypothetical protein